MVLCIYTYLYKHILKSSVTMLRALYADFDACFEHYMYILKASLKALKRDFSSINRQGLVRLQRILSFGNENCFLVAMVGSNAVYLTTSLPNFPHCVRSAAGGKAAGKK